MSYRNSSWKPVTHADIEDALKRFLEQGGTIKHLRSQKDNPQLTFDSMENEDWMTVYEITGVPLKNGNVN